MLKKKGNETFEKILETSRILFNKNNEENVTTNHIAAYLKISPGNLYYYFKNKNEIIRNIFQYYKDEIMSFIENTEIPLTGSYAVKFQEGIFKIFDKYRFIFASLAKQFNHDELFREDYIRFSKEIEPLIIRRFQELRDNHIIDIDEEELRILAHNFWLISKFWFVFDKIFDYDDFEKSKKEGIRHSLALLSPYVTPENIDEFKNAAAITLKSLR